MKRLHLLLALALLAPSLEAQDPTSFSTSAVGSITAANAACLSTTCVWLTAPYTAGSLSLQISGTFVATLQFEASVNGSVWSAINSSSQQTSTTAPGLWSFTLSGTQMFRVRASAYTSGTVAVNIGASAVSGWFASPPIGLFNAFDQATANGKNLVLQLNEPTSWSPIIGLSETNNVSPQFNVGGYFQATATNTAGSMPNNIGLFGEGDGFPTGAGTLAFLGGVEGLTELHSGTATAQSAFISYTRVDTGTTTTNLYDFVTQGHVIAGTVVNNYGIFMADIVGGTTINSALWTGLGWNHLGDFTSIGGTISTRPNNFLAIKGSGAGIVSAGQISDASTFGCVTFQSATCAVANYFIGSDGTDLRLNSPAATIVLAANNAAKLTVSSTTVTAAVPIAANSGANIIYRCSVAGTLRVGQTTTVSADCGTAVDTGFRAN